MELLHFLNNRCRTILTQVLTKNGYFKGKRLNPETGRGGGQLCVYKARNTGSKMMDGTSVDKRQTMEEMAVPARSTP